MSKKGLLVLFMVVFFVGGVFAQNSFSSMAKNTVTIDVGPTIVGFAVGPAINMLGMEELTASGLGVAGQYERMLSSSLSVAVRGAYLGVNGDLAIDKSQSGVTATGGAKINLTSFSGEGHVRFYPLGDTFFLDGLVGFAQLNANLDGDVKISGYGSSATQRTTFDGTQNYLKLGAKVGWRMSFGRNGGFTFEPALGYSYGIGLGDPLQAQLKAKLGSDAPDFNDALDIVENFIFISGPRVSLAFGYRF